VSGGWAGSKRSDGLPSWWPVTVRRILRRDPQCRCDGCEKCNRANPSRICCRASTDVDHIIRGDNHKDDNLRGICRPCHGHKSSREGNAAKAARRQSTRPAEKHPGDLT
jgi:5-methylcytosine-specific restriction enzyme A